MKWVLILTVIASLLSGSAVLAADNAVSGEAPNGIDRSIDTSPLSWLADTSAAQRDRPVLREFLDRVLGEHRTRTERMLGDNSTIDLQRRPVLPIPVAEAQPNLHLEADDLMVQECGSGFQFNGTLTNRSRPEDVQAVDAEKVELVYQVIEGEGYIESITITPSFWEVIPAGSQVEFRVDVTLDQSLDLTLDRAIVKVAISIASEIRPLDRSVDQLNLTLLASCPRAPSTSGEMPVPANEHHR